MKTHRASALLLGFVALLLVTPSSADNVRIKRVGGLAGHKVLTRNGEEISSSYPTIKKMRDLYVGIRGAGARSGALAPLVSSLKGSSTWYTILDPKTGKALLERNKIKVSRNGEVHVYDGYGKQWQRLDSSLVERARAR